jgi:DNA-binding CsgD family transcriptional regulator
MFNYYYSTTVRERKDLKFTINYRVRRNDEKYIMLQQELVFTEISCDGYPIADFSTCTDISAYKHDNSLKLIVHKKQGNNYNEVYEYTINEQVDLLTQRQIEILNLLSKGFTTCQIAQKLFLSEETVKIHRKNILHRTGAKNSIQAVNILLNNELVHSSV